MQNAARFYIDGSWVEPSAPRMADVINPATEEPVAQIALAGPADVDRAVDAARQAFGTFSLTDVAERRALLQRLLSVFERRLGDLAAAITQEMGAPRKLALDAQAASGVEHLTDILAVLDAFSFEERRGRALLRREPIGVVAAITPWNWPVSQAMLKLTPALAAGCTIVLKPSELAPLSGILLAEIFDEAGVPPGVVNVLNGDGPVAGRALASHQGIEMISFTGSTIAGIDVARLAAETVKRVHQELGGKSANLILRDCDLDWAVKAGVERCFRNSGQNCNAPSRMLVPQELLGKAEAIAAATADALRTGDPLAEDTNLGPLANKKQFEKVQTLIRAGIAEGNKLVAGGEGRPRGLDHGYFVRPTVFTSRDNNTTIAREEVFGPVLCLIPYSTEDEAVAIANDTVYGLAAYVASGDPEHARRVAARLRAGNVHINYATGSGSEPFGGYKRSGNGREQGAFGLAEYLEVKAVIEPAAA